MGTIPSQNIEQIAAANDIVEVIGSYFPLKRAGTTFKALCPFHQEKTPSFTVSPSRQTFHCFGCGAGGSVFRFVMDYEHLDFPSAVRKLAARAGVPVIEERSAVGGDDDRQHETRRALLQLHGEAAEWFHENLVKAKIGAPAREYLKGRGIDLRIAKDWQIGFAPLSWDAFLKWALDRGYQQRLLLESGLITRRDESGGEDRGYDRFRNRIMFPIHNDVGEVIAFSGRILEKETEAAKYVNSPETPLFRKGRVLFGLHKTKRGLIQADCAIVCEGQLDLITLFEAGITNVVAPQGTAFTENQARILKRFVSEVVLCFDADTAGQKAAERSLDALLQNDLLVRIVEMPAHEDPDSFVRKEGAEAFEKLISGSREFFEFWVEREAQNTDLNSLRDRVQLARRLGETINRVRDAQMRNEIALRVASRLGVPASEFRSMLQASPNPGSNQWLTSQGAAIEAPIYDWRKIDFLCLLALHSKASRDFLLSQDWREVTDTSAQMEPLECILNADFNPDESASVSAFMSSLEPGQDAFMAKLLARKPPQNADQLVVLWWNGLKRDAVERKLRATESRLKAPELTTGESVNLQKQILDLTEQLRELSTFSPAHVLDT
jgi:DNA primase